MEILSATKIGKRLINQFFIVIYGKQFPIRGMLDLERILYVLSWETANAFIHPVVKRPSSAEDLDISSQSTYTEGTLTIPLGLLVGKDSTFDLTDDSFDIMKPSIDCNTWIPGWGLKNYQAKVLETGHLHLPKFANACSGYDTQHNKYCMDYENIVALSPDAIDIEAVMIFNPSIAESPPVHCQQSLPLFDSSDPEKTSSNKECNYTMKLTVWEENYEWDKYTNTQQGKKTSSMSFLMKRSENKQFDHHIVQ